ncbi:MAG: hypothetical protein ACODAJ_00465 [Planctomycetota bacterium]
MSIQEAARSGDIVREQWPLRKRDHLNLYLGSGRAGACFDAWGLMHNGSRGEPRVSQGNTTLLHADHWHRGAWGLDYWLPVARLLWAADPPEPPPRYRQSLSLYDGRLRTALAWPTLRLALEATFHPDRRDLLAIALSWDAAADHGVPPLLVAPETEVHTHYDQHLTGQAETIEKAEDWWACRLRVGTAGSVVALRAVCPMGEADLATCDGGLRLSFGGERGRCLLLIGAAGAERQHELATEMRAVAVPEEFLAEAAQAWHRRWGSAWLHVPVPEYQALWARSLYYVLASYAPDVRSPAPPNGWSGNGWPFHFPQDVSYIHPALLRLGHFDIARAWVDFYRRSLDDMRAYTERVYGAKGTMWAWEFPIGPDSQLLAEGHPNWCQFEIHNAAYPARMAREASHYVRDPAWTREVAWPVVKGSARFYASILRQEEDRTWGMAVEPSFGQDEMGGHNARNYLCALFSTQYALTTALAMGDELGKDPIEFDRWRAILADGLAFGRLHDPETDLLVTCEGLSGVEQLGREKHPVQLNPLTFLPLGKPFDHVVRAYQRRADLCAGVRAGRYHGWTLAAFWLAAAHIGDAEGLVAELGQALPARYVDRAWLQIYETSGAVHMPYYVTSHGLYLQALTDALVTDYWRWPQVGAACPDTWREARFGGLHVADGRVLSGHRTRQGWQVTEDTRT